MGPGALAWTLAEVLGDVTQSRERESFMRAMVEVGFDSRRAHYPNSEAEMARKIEFGDYVRVFPSGKVARVVGSSGSGDLITFHIEFEDGSNDHFVNPVWLEVVQRRND